MNDNTQRYSQRQEETDLFRVVSHGGAFSGVHFSSKTDDWSTPDWLFRTLNGMFHFTLDPCSSRENAKCARHFTPVQNGLLQDWGRERVFMNPPYGREIGHWMKKAATSAARGALVLCLVPARTDTAWWHSYATLGEIWFLRGRIKFGNATSCAPFPSAIVIFRPDNFSITPQNALHPPGDSSPVVHCRHLQLKPES